MKIQGKFGFGCMRLPMKGKEVDIEQVKQMVDEFIAAGFNYFDTAHGYLEELSEKAVCECLVKRYPRESYFLTNKLTCNYFTCEKDLMPLFELQLQRCGVDYFDYYLFHAVNREYYKKFTDCNAFAFMKQLKASGKIKHIGMSFHDQPEVLDQILSEHPEIEVVQIQYNYLDHDNPNVESEKVYQICLKHHKPVIVMEPVKGGNLVGLPQQAAAILEACHEGSQASYAIRYCASQQNVFMVLSGMSTIDQMRDNISFMKDFKPFDEREYQAVAQVREVLKKLKKIECTACQYCVAGCPKQIPIPDLFADYNAKTLYSSWSASSEYEKHIEHKGKASDCIKCGKCEHSCPQHLHIRELLEQVAQTFEQNQ